MLDLYFVTDIEADGPLPGQNSMIAYASIAIDNTGKEVDAYAAYLGPMEGAAEDPDTILWWDRTAPQELEKIRRLAEFPEISMKQYCKWVEQLAIGHKASAIFVGYPATYDFMFVYYYLLKYAKRSPFSFSGLDIKTLAFSATKHSFRDSHKKNFPPEWFDEKLQHTHNALDDAREQAYTFIQIMKTLGKM